MKTLRGYFDYEKGLYNACDEPLVFHCHHYASFLLFSLESAREYVDIYPLMHDAAQEISYTQFSKFFTKNPDLTLEEKLEAIADYHAFSGYGKLEFEKVTIDEILVKSPHNFFSVGWLEKFGTKRPDDYPGASLMTTGFLSGIADLIFEKPLGSYQTEQFTCLSKGDDISSFKITPRAIRANLELTPSMGDIAEDGLKVINHPDSNVNYEGILKAFTEMPFDSEADTGLKNVFGVVLSRIYGNYFSAVSYRFLYEMEKVAGEEGVKIAEELLIEAGHVCSSFTLGGIMTSPEWYAMIKPTLETQEDWVHASVACLNALGFGYHEITEFIPNEKLVVRIHNAYESNYFVARYGQSERPIFFLQIGGLAALMNLVYVGKIEEKPSITAEFYDSFYKSKERFKGVQTKSRAHQDAFDEIMVVKA